MNSKTISFIIPLVFLLASCGISSEVKPDNSITVDGELIVYDPAQDLFFLQDITTGKRTSIPGIDNNDMRGVGATPDNKWLFIRPKQSSNTFYLVSLDGKRTTVFEKDNTAAFLKWTNHNWLVQWRDPFTPINVLNPFTGESQVLKSEYPYILSPPVPTMEFAKWSTFLIFDPALERVIYVGDILKIPDNTGLLWLADVATGQVLSNIDAKLITDNPPVWSPDGQFFIAVDTEKSIGQQSIFDIYLFDRNGRKVSQLTHYDAEQIIEYISWSPNNRFIAFLRGYAALSVIDVQSNKLIKELKIDLVPSRPGRFIWLPDGWQLIFQKANQKALTSDTDPTDLALVLYDLCKNTLSEIKNSNNLVPLGWISAGNNEGVKRSCDSPNNR
jgi:dipeptidyl aminopeptidase/acylaminoacyl peptidase